MKTKQDYLNALEELKPRLMFRPGTWDEAVFTDVALRDEYRMADFDLSCKAVLDVGANIGSFCAVAAVHGARLIHAYEPNAENFEVLRRNVAVLERFYPECTIRIYREALTSVPAKSVSMQGEGPNRGGLQVTELRQGDEGALTCPPAVAVRYLQSAMADELFGIVLKPLAKIDVEFAEWDLVPSDPRLWGPDNFSGLVGEVHCVPSGDVMKTRLKFKGALDLSHVEGFSAVDFGRVLENRCGWQDRVFHMITPEQWIFRSGEVATWDY